MLKLITWIIIIIDSITYLIMLLFLFIERFFRFGEKAKDLKTTETDNGTTRLIGLAFVICMVLLFVTIGLNYLEIGFFSNNLLFMVIGFLGMITGMLIRLFAVRTLGSFYTSTLQTSTDQMLVDKGLYHYVRNPGYLGYIVLFFSTSVALANIIPIIIIPCIIIPVYLRRISSEEKMLSKSFGEVFENYKLKTKRLIPYIY